MGRTRLKLSEVLSDKPYKLPDNPLSEYGLDTISPAGVAGFAFESATDPTNLIPFAGMAKGAGKLGKKALSTGADIAGEAVQLGTKAVPAAGYVIGGVKPKFTKEYIKRSADIDAAQTIPEIRQGILDDAGKINQNRDNLISQLDDSKARLKDIYNEKKLSLGSENVNLEDAREIMAALEGEKSHLGQLSKQADEALAASGVSFQRDDLVALIEKIGKKRGEFIIGDAENAALQKLSTTHERLKSLPANIESVQLRDILKQVRKDIDFDQAAGEFNDTLTQMRKEFSRSVSEALKDASPEYAKHMNHMADISENLNKMKDMFGTEHKAMSQLENLRKGVSPSSKVSRDVLARYGQATGRTDLLDKVTQGQEKSNLLREMKRRDLTGQMFPDNVAEIEKLKGLVAKSKGLSGEIKKLTPQSTEAVVKNLGGVTPQAYNREVIEALARESGNNPMQAIKDRGTLDSFSKDATRGSRLTNLGGMAGATVGGMTSGGPGAAVGMAAGGLVGTTLDKYAGQTIKGSVKASLKIQDQLKKISALLMQDSAFAKKYGSILEKTANRGQKALIVTHHMLMNSRPDYREKFIENN